MGAFNLSLPLRRVGPFCNEIPAAGREGRGGEGGRRGSRGRGGREEREGGRGRREGRGGRGGEGGRKGREDGMTLTVTHQELALGTILDACTPPP